MVFYMILVCHFGIYLHQMDWTNGNAHNNKQNESKVVDKAKASEGRGKVRKNRERLLMGRKQPAVLKSRCIKSNLFLGVMWVCALFHLSTVSRLLIPFATEWMSQMESEREIEKEQIRTENDIYNRTNITPRRKYGSQNRKISWHIY